MKLLYISLFVLVVSAASQCKASDGWVIDEPLRFQLAYIPDSHVNTTNGIRVESMGYFPDYAPDIDNINLAGIKEMGFPLPDRENPEQFKLYLKLFHFPPMLDSKGLCLKILEDYHISDAPKSAKLVEFVSTKSNVAVKYGYIDKKDKAFSVTAPFPKFIACGDADFASYFARNIRFCSLYIKPDLPPNVTNDDELAAYSASSVIAFHKELLDHYNDSLEQISGSEPDKYYYFHDELTETTIKIPVAPIVFENWRSLPMPTNPSHHFLSALLIIYRYQDKEVDSPLAHETVFEVSSVVRLK